uniref:F-box protein 48 n=1 Tax=Pipistrellus kuhlii TaxID=59472 RepID=A0A7J7VUR8_PIPKU|nr:F-box protein 48 [Pipistrellus kuhlii]
MNEDNLVEWMPPEMIECIFHHLEIQSLCRASMTCVSWFDTIRNNDFLWKPHCLAIQDVCKREVDDDQKNGYSWKDILLRNYKKSQVIHGWLSGRFSNIDLPTLLSETTIGYSWRDILLRNYKKSQVKHGWLSGRFSNIDLPTLLSKTTMCQMDAETWGEILEAELNGSEIKNDSRESGCYIIRNNHSLRKPHCEAIQAVCKREVDDGQKNGYSWKDIHLRNDKKSQVKHGWLSGRFSNIDLPTLLSETTMCPMDAETWGKILEAELNGSKIKNDSRESGY